MNLSVVILAAGRGKRMNSSIPKVLHGVLGRPMLQYAVDAVRPLKPKKLIVVVGNGAGFVKESVGGEDITFVVQDKLLGTGNALAVAKRKLGIDDGTVLVLNGDCPLITTKTLKRFLTRHKFDRNVLSLLSFIDDSLSGYGRVIRSENGRVIGIIEEKHATLEERRRVKELNGGVYLIESEILNYLKRLRKNPSSGEYYLTDMVGIISTAGKRLNAYCCPPEEIRGVNTREELYRVSEILNKRIVSKWMRKGVTFIDPDASIVHPSVSIGKDTIIYPNTHLEGRTLMGRNCVIYPGTRIHDSVLADSVTIKDNTLIEESRIGEGTVIGPFAHLRPHSVIGRSVKIGNFVEIKSSQIDDGTKAQHLSYIGDSTVGKNVNIGAGTITCNYDGVNKYRTEIESGVFIGSDSQLVAPVKIGKDAYVAAGATITKDVPPGALAISRTNQRNLAGWTKKKEGQK